MFLGLDPATRCGFAVWSPGMERPYSGTFDLPSDGTDVGGACVAVHRSLSRLFTAHRFERLFFEAPIPPHQIMGETQFRTIYKAIGIATHIESWSKEMNVRCRLVPMGHWRRFFVGKGAGEKTATFKSWAMDRCQQLGWNARNHDEADALGVLAYGVSLDPAFTPPWHDALTFAPQFAPKPKRRAAR